MTARIANAPIDIAPIDINVRAGQPRATYAIRIAAGLLDDLGRHLRDIGVLRETDNPRKRPASTDSGIARRSRATSAGGRIVIVSSPRIWALHGARLRAALPDTPHVLVPDGERAKHLRTVARVYDGLVAAGADRQTVLVVLGGGVLGDLAGFAAASYLRGIPLVHIPTTVVAQVDSAIGGKVGVNHPLGKNLIGAFYPPRAVLSDPQVLLTLSAREYRAGLYEVIKYGVIASPRLFARLESSLDQVLARDREVMTDIIAECSRIKARVVMADEHEQGERRILNFGHTAGHALEAITNYRRFRHGEAVGQGMLVAADLAHARGALPTEAYERVRTLIARLGALPAVEDLSIGDCLAAMQRDKKVVRGTLHFVLPIAIGKTAIVSDVEPRELRDALRRLGLRR